MARRPNWSPKLTEAIEDIDGKVLSTLAETWAYVLAHKNRVGVVASHEAQA